jgi:hypothetical protein
VESGDPVEERDEIQPQACVIFRGKGLRIKASEKAAYAPEIDVLFQTNAWVDRPTGVKWSNTSWLAGC